MTILLLAAGKAGFADSSRGGDLEPNLKAAFIGKFIDFTEWPPGSGLADSTTPFIVAVLDDKPFAATLKKLFPNKKIHLKPVEVRSIAGFEEASGCHVLYLGDGFAGNLPELLAAVQNRPILTIAHTDGFASQGGHINFYLTAKKTLHFEINEKKVREAGLKMDLRLIEIAKIVSP